MGAVTSMSTPMIEEVYSFLFLRDYYAVFLSEFMGAVYCSSFKHVFVDNHLAHDLSYALLHK